MDLKVVNTAMSCFYKVCGKAPALGKTAGDLSGYRKSWGSLPGGCYAWFRPSRVDDCKANQF